LIGSVYWPDLLGQFIGPDGWSLTSSSPGSAFCADHRANVVTAVRKVDGWCESNGAPPETDSSVAASGDLDGDFDGPADAVTTCHRLARAQSGASAYDPALT
jgi:hypothetical protein